MSIKTPQSFRIRFRLGVRHFCVKVCQYAFSHYVYRNVAFALKSKRDQDLIANLDHELADETAKMWKEREDYLEKCRQAQEPSDLTILFAIESRPNAAQSRVQDSRDRAAAARSKFWISEAEIYAVPVPKADDAEHWTGRSLSPKGEYELRTLVRRERRERLNQCKYVSL